MHDVFRIVDKTGRVIRLSSERWRHIRDEHPRVNDLYELQRALQLPLRIMASKYEPERAAKYYRYIKELGRYLLVAVKYLNGEGYVITAFFVRSI